MSKLLTQLVKIIIFIFFKKLNIYSLIWIEYDVLENQWVK